MALSDRTRSENGSESGFTDDRGVPFGRNGGPEDDIRILSTLPNAMKPEPCPSVLTEGRPRVQEFPGLRFVAFLSRRNPFLSRP